MRSFSAGLLAYIANPESINAHVLVWVSAKDRTTGVVTPVGIWTGDDDLVFTINGVSRTYYGRGGLIEVPAINYTAELNVNTIDVEFAPLSAEVAQMIRGYDSRQAPVEIHRAVFDPTSNVLLEEPHRIYRGRVDKIQITTPKQNGTARLTMTVASNSRSLTRNIPARRSDETQKLRSTDRFMRYTVVTQVVETVWGEIRKTAAPPASSGGAGGSPPKQWGDGRDR
jgi:hypothetical protein